MGITNNMKSRLKIRIKSKKAIELLGEHTVNLIIAALCIVVLVMVGIALYNSLLVDKKRVMNAQAELKEIMEKVEVLQENGGGSMEKIILQPVGWAIVGWPVLDGPNAGLSTNYCISKGWVNCLCLCKADVEGADRINWARFATPSGIRQACDDVPVCSEIKAKKFIVTNPGFETQMTPILLNSLSGAYIGTLNITYDKTLDKLTIINKK
jgi:hypothetical protein